MKGQKSMRGINLWMLSLFKTCLHHAIWTRSVTRQIRQCFMVNLQTSPIEVHIAWTQTGHQSILIFTFSHTIY